MALALTGCASTPHGASPGDAAQAQPICGAEWARLGYEDGLFNRSPRDPAVHRASCAAAGLPAPDEAGYAVERSAGAYVARFARSSSEGIGGGDDAASLDGPARAAEALRPLAPPARCSAEAARIAGARGGPVPVPCPDLSGLTRAARAGRAERTLRAEVIAVDRAERKLERDLMRPSLQPGERSVLERRLRQVANRRRALSSTKPPGL